MELYRLLRGEVARRDLSGALFSRDGYVYLNVARAQALRQLLAQVWLLPTLSRQNSNVLTEVVASAVNACSIRLVVGLRPPAEYE